MEIFTKIVNELIDKNKTIATMESCTGGALASEITNVPGASDILKFSAVTYSNEYKIKMGVSKDIIDKYSVYSRETAIEMAKNIQDFAHSDFGIGITGKINRSDKANDFGDDEKVFICIYEKENNKLHELELDVIPNIDRKINKEYIVQNVGNFLYDLLTK